MLRKRSLDVYVHVCDVYEFVYVYVYVYACSKRMDSMSMLYAVPTCASLFPASAE